MDVPRILATALALNRAVFGWVYVLAPEQARTSWIGRAAKKPGAQVFIRSQGMRDVALGAGALRAVARAEAPELRAWMLAHAASDLTDFVATWLVRDKLPRRRARLALGIAAGSTAVGAAAAAGLRDPGR